MLFFWPCPSRPVPSILCFCVVCAGLTLPSILTLTNFAPPDPFFFLDLSYLIKRDVRVRVHVMHGYGHGHGHGHGIISSVKEMVGSHGVVVYSKTYCPYCTKAKTALNAIGAKYEVRVCRSGGSTVIYGFFGRDVT